MPLAKRLSIGLEIRQSELVKVAAEAAAAEVKPFTVLVAVAANWPARAQVKGAPISHSSQVRLQLLCPPWRRVPLPWLRWRPAHVMCLARQSHFTNDSSSLQSVL